MTWISVKVELDMIAKRNRHLKERTEFLRTESKNRPCWKPILRLVEEKPSVCLQAQVTPHNC